MLSRGYEKQSDSSHNINCIWCYTVYRSVLIMEVSLEMSICCYCIMALLFVMLVFWFIAKYDSNYQHAKNEFDFWWF